MLKSILWANAGSCAIFGALFVIWPSPAAAFLGDPPDLILRLLGTALLFNAAHLIFTAKQANPARWLVLYFALGDALWVLATAILIASGFWITTTSGILVASLVAIFVGACGAGQAHYAPPPRPTAT